MNSDLLRQTAERIRPIANPQMEAALRARLDQLTKPPGSLGRLEDLAVRTGLIQRTEWPRASSKVLFVCCADHGVTAEGVSPYPQEVTRQMVANFQNGRAAINVLCRQYDIEARVVDCGVRNGLACGGMSFRLGDGTANFTRQLAMSREQAEQSLSYGIQLALDAAETADLLAVGEMGIGNTTTAAALFSAFTGLDPKITAGRGTGLDDAGVERKRAVIRQALALHRPDPADAVGTLASLGGFEIGLMAGVILGAAAAHRPVILDGFVTGAAAFVARAIRTESLEAAVFSHCSAEHGHRRMLAELGAEPLLDLRMRLGEGTGAAIAAGLVESAVRLYTEMSTFAEASVSNR
jgi:nicotinate-nucleotide--dimethylbenzimidazole phosphoribosyltransferase